MCFTNLSAASLLPSLDVRQLHCPAAYTGHKSDRGSMYSTANQHVFIGFENIFNGQDETISFATRVIDNNTH